MKSKYKRILAAFAALLLIALVILFADSVVGNPISKMQAAEAINSYLAATYPDTDYKLDKVTFNFKFHEYNGTIVSPSSDDSRFEISWSNNKITYDSYEFYVTQRQNTLYRYERELRDQIRTLLASVPEVSIEHMYVSVCKEYYESDLSALLVLDAPYDNSLNIPMELSITINNSAPTVEDYASVLKQIHKILDSKGFLMNYYSIDNSTEEASSRLWAGDITPADIQSGQLSSLLNAASLTTEEDSSATRKLYVYSFEK